MSAPYSFLHFACEDVLYAFVEREMGGASGLNIYRTADATAFSAQIAEPSVMIECASSRVWSDLEDVDLPGQLGYRQIEARVCIRSHAADVMENGSYSTFITKCRENHASLVGQVLDLFQRSDIVAQLNGVGVPGITIGRIDGGEQRTVPVERSYQTDLGFLIVSSPKVTA